MFLDLDGDDYDRPAASAGHGAGDTGGAGEKPMEWTSGRQGHEQATAQEDVLHVGACPICMDVLRDAYLTRCGHSFCYRCITTHLDHKSDCPTCSRFVSSKDIFPNVKLSEVLTVVDNMPAIASRTPMEVVRQAITDRKMSSADIESMIRELSTSKGRIEREECEDNLQVLLEFLKQSRHLKAHQLTRLRGEVESLDHDMEYLRVSTAPSGDGEASGSGTGSGAAGGHADVPLWLGGGEHGGGAAGADAAAAAARRKKVFAQFGDLQACYLGYVSKQTKDDERPRSGAGAGAGAGAAGVSGGGGGGGGGKGAVVGGGWGGVGAGTQMLASGAPLPRPSYALSEFSRTLEAITRYDRIKVVAQVSSGGESSGSSIVSSIDFDRDDALFAIAGVTKSIRVYDFASVVSGETVDPVLDMSTRSKLSCLSWNKFQRSHIASSDYEGVVTLWDASTSRSLIDYEEHEKRVWSVDFCSQEPTLLLSGSDDGKVKVWSTKQPNSVLSIDVRANVCCVKYNPGSSRYIAVGSADHKIHYYDVRQLWQPLSVFTAHRKAVSYVEFVDSSRLVSASTDSTVRIWDVDEKRQVRTLTGHTNEKNFVGLSVNSDYIACGSETDDVYVFYKEISRPTTVFAFGRDEDLRGEEDRRKFISAVCWRSNTSMMVAANSLGKVKILSLEQAP